MTTIDTFDFSGKRVLIRVDFNVPLNDSFEVTDDTRIRAALPTIKKVMESGGRVILMSHLGRPKTGPEDKFSLRHIISNLEGHLSKSVKFVSDCVGQESVAQTSEIQNGDVAVLENLRFYKEETGGDEFFAGQLAEHADVYINDAFGTAHRAHASTAVIARFFPHDKLFGYVMENEITNIDKVLHHAEKPVAAIVGGAKVSSKITILENLLDKCDSILIGGGMAFTFIKAQGGQVGSSLVEDDKLNMALDILKRADELGVKIVLPTDAVAADKLDNEANRQTIASNAIGEGWMGLDIGPESVVVYQDAIMNSKTILWNGPMGVFEMSNFAQGTIAVAQTLAKATAEKGAFTLVGGGDSVAAVNQFDLADQVSYVSTGGGAMLEYLEGKMLPGIAAVRE